MNAMASEILLPAMVPAYQGVLLTSFSRNDYTSGSSGFNALDGSWQYHYFPFIYPNTSKWWKRTKLVNLCHLARVKTSCLNTSPLKKSKKSAQIYFRVSLRVSLLSICVNVMTPLVLGSQLDSQNFAKHSHRNAKSSKTFTRKVPRSGLSAKLIFAPNICKFPRTHIHRWVLMASCKPVQKSKAWPVLVLHLVLDYFDITETWEFPASILVTKNAYSRMRLLNYTQNHPSAGQGTHL